MNANSDICSKRKFYWEVMGIEKPLFYLNYVLKRGKPERETEGRFQLLAWSLSISWALFLQKWMTSSYSQPIANVPSAQVFQLGFKLASFMIWVILSLPFQQQTRFNWRQCLGHTLLSSRSFILDCCVVCWWAVVGVFIILQLIPW